MEIAESGHLAADFEQPFLQLEVFQISLLVKYFPCFRDDRLLGNDPSVQRTADGSQPPQGMRQELRRKRYPAATVRGKRGFCLYSSKKRLVKRFCGSILCLASKNASMPE